MGLYGHLSPDEPEGDAAPLTDESAGYGSIGCASRPHQARRDGEHCTADQHTPADEAILHTARHLCLYYSNVLHENIDCFIISQLRPPNCVTIMRCAS
jgi:hypothetical protein